MEQRAAKLGLAFQIQDDVLDVTSTREVLGKPVGSDEKNNKAAPLPPWRCAPHQKLLYPIPQM